MGEAAQVLVGALMLRSCPLLLKGRTKAEWGNKDRLVPVLLLQAVLVSRWLC